MVGRGYYVDDCFDPYGLTYGPSIKILRWGGEIGVHRDPWDEYGDEVIYFNRLAGRIASLPNPKKRPKPPLWPPDLLTSPKVAARPQEAHSRRPWRSGGAKRPGLGLRNFRKVV